MHSRTLRRAVAALAVGIGVAAFVPSGATAHWNRLVDGCTGVNGQAFTCFQIYGNSGTTHVDKFVQVYDTAAGYACNYHARFTVSLNGSTYWSATTSKHSGCYYSPRVTRTYGVERNFYNNSKACGSWYMDGSRVGTACNYLYG